jgi:predicted transcriptional regulator
MWLKKFVNEFKPQKVGIRKILGDLESDIMEIIWQKDKTSVREVYETLRLEREIAYTTVMTIMGRLADKNLLSKETVGNAYHYTPTVSRNEFAKKVVTEVLDGLFEDFAEPAMSHFVDKLSKENKDKISELEALIQEKRLEGGKS